MVHRCYEVWFLSLLLLIVACRPSGPTRPPIAPQPAARACPEDCSDPWVLVETKHKRLTVMRGREAVKVFEGVALGASGAGLKRRRGDDVTPLGRFRVVSVRPSRKFTLFIELDYPSPADAERGLSNGTIDAGTYERICRAHERGLRPPQDTPLGGYIGIHGVGNGSLAIHQMVNWTAGCLALDNRQIRDLTKIIRPGVIIEVR